MKLNKMFLISITLLILLLSISSVSASDLGQDSNQTLATDSSEVETVAVNEDVGDVEAVAVNEDVDVVQEIESSSQNVLSSDSEDSTVKGSTEEIVVNDWNDLQYYCSLTDADYTLRLKENTNYYPVDVTDENYQILVNNNVKIIGNTGAYIGDTSPDAANITYTAILVPDNNHKGIIMENVTFKWIGTRYQPDGVFLQMGGNVTNNAFINCYFTNISTNLGHSSILYIKTGNVDVINCTFINCTTDFGCLSVYNPKDDPTDICTSAAMNVTESYFEGNYARTEPGCINNCGILVVNNSTFYKNSAFWWAGAIHTHGGANTTIYDSDFIDNLAGWNGGALYTYSYLQIYNTRFIGNNCTTNNGGGAIGACKYLHAPYIRIEECLFENNENLCWGLDELSTSGTGRGGAISLMDEGGLEVYNSVFIKNSASIGTAICAINGGLSYGSPDVRIVGNSFINHTRVGDVLDVRVATGSVAEIRDNYYYNNSLVYEKLKLTADDPIDGIVTFHLDARLKNPTSFDADILDKSDFDVYVNGAYRTTVSSTTFDLDIGKGNTAKVYVMPSISNSKSNEVSAGIAKKIIYVSQSSGNDANTGLTRSKSVKTLAKAIQLANSTGNIVLIDGTFKETNLTINYNLTIASEKNAVITITGNGFTITDGDVKFENVTFKNCKYGSNAKNRIISQTNSGFLIMEGCVFEGNEYRMHIDAAGILDGENLKFTNNKDGSLIKANSISLKSSVFINNTATYSTAKGLVMYKTGTTKFEVENLTFINNTVSAGCIDVKKNKATISGCTFIGNKITSGNKGSAILMEDSCSVLIESSKFINNTDVGKYSSVIYVSSGTLLIRDSILINNSYENTNGIVINGGETYLKKLQASNNWWGNTPDDLTKPALKTYGVSNQLPNGWDPAQYWLVLNATSLSNKVELNERVQVQFTFTQIDNDGNVTGYDSNKLPSFDLALTAVNGTCSNNRVPVENGVANTYFTLNKIASSSLTGSINGISATINFTFKKSVPDISVVANDINVGKTASIVVHVPSDATGTVLLTVGDITKNATISNSKATFSISGLAAGTYTAEATYNGNNHYLSNFNTATFNVNKLESTTTVSVGALTVNKDVNVTITLPNDATGKVDVYVNGVKNQTINAGSIFTIPKIKRGIYTVKAVYKGDSKYLPSEGNCTFDVGRITPSMTVTVQNITYGNDVVVSVTLTSGATGNVTATVDGKSSTATLTNSKATLRISGIDAGNNKKVTVVYSGSNDYKNASATKTFNVAKASLDFTITSNNIKVGKDEIVEITLPARIGGTLTITGIKSETKNVPSSGLVKLTYEDLAVGTYTVKAKYTGNNYATTTKSTSFTVSEWNQAESANEGINIERTGKTVTVTTCNGAIKWSATVGNITGNLAIDSQKNVYITTETAIYSYSNAGNLRWVFTSNSAGANFAGVALSRDVVIAPKVNDTLYFINQSTGERYGHANLYQGSSSFSPVVDSNGNIYISGQGESNNPNLVIIPYKIWENGGTPIEIALGSNPTAAPTIISENLVAVPCEDSIKVVDISSKTLAFSKSGNINEGYAVAGEGNVIYTFLGNYIYKFSESGTKLWSTKVTDGVGEQLFLDSEIALYSVNSKGVLYSYDIVDGTQSKFCDLTVTSGILIDGNNNLYFGAGEDFYAFDSDGNVLWKANIGSKIIGTPVMNKNGIICINTADKVYALKYLAKQDPNLVVSGENIIVGEDETISISLNENATGTVKIVVDGKTYTANVINGNAIKVISNLAAGSYTAKVTYNGDMRYSQVTKSSTFNVVKYDAKMNVTANNINYGQNAVFNAVLPADATGTVSVTVNGKSGSSSVSNGKASVSISGLAKGDYSYTVTYSGNGKYNSDTKTSTISVGKTKTAFNVANISTINVDDLANFVISGLPNDATGTITVVVDGKSSSAQVSNGGTTIGIKMSAEGTYVADVSYTNDNNYMANAKKVTFAVAKIKPTMSVAAEDINVGDTANFVISGLPSDATGTVNLTIGDISKSAKVSNGKATISISGLTYGSKTASITYSGNYKYTSISASKKITVSKVTPTYTIDFNKNIYVGDNVEFKVNMNPDATGTITVTADGKTGSADVANGEATITITSFTEGSKTPKVTYSGDGKYKAFTNSSGTIKVVKKNVPITVDYIDNINVGDNLTINVALTQGVGGTVTVVIGDEYNKTFNAKSKLSITVPNLTYGSKQAAISYSGDSKFNAASTTSNKFTVSKIAPSMTASVTNINVGESAIFNVVLPSDATGKVTVKVGGKSASSTVSGGKSSITVSNLPSGSEDAVITYSGDGKYLSNSITRSLSVNKLDSSMTATVSNIKVGKSAVFKVKLVTAATGTVTVKVDGKTASATLSKGAASVTVDDLKAGEYVANIYYSGDSKYNSNSITKDLVVSKNNPSMTVKTSNINVGSKAVFTVTLNSDATGNVTVNVGGQSGSASISSGVAKVSISGLKEGTYTASVSYVGNAKYNPASASKGITVSKVSPSMNVTAKASIYVGDDETFTIKLPTDASGIAAVTIDGKYNSGQLVKGTLTLKITGLTYGTKSANITYSGDDKYLPANVTKTVKVVKVTPDVNAVIKDINYGKNATVSVTLSSGATGTVKVTVDGKSYTADVKNSKASVVVPGLKAGSKNATITYSGDSKFKTKTINSIFNVKKITAKVTASVKTINYGKNATVSVTVPSDATGTVKVLVNGKSYSATIKNSKASVVVPGLKAGTYQVNITYNGNANYLKSTVSKDLVVNKITPSLKVTVSDINVGETAVFKVVLPTDATGSVSAKAYSITNTSKISKGKASVSINGIASGNRTYIVKYAGDSNYLPTNCSAKIYVSKVNPSLSATTSNIFVGDKAVFNVKVASDATGSISLLINNNTYTGKISKGSAAINVKGLPAGSYSAKISYAGDSKYLSATINKKITVSKISKFTINSTSDGSIITFDLPSDAKGEMTLNINGKDYVGTVSKGKVSFTTDLASGKYKSKLVYSGDNKYVSKSLNRTITITLDVVNISAPEVTCYYSGAFTATLKDSNGNAISKAVLYVKLNGKEYKLTTNAKGTVTTGTLTLPVGSYDVNVYFNQTTKYASSNVTSKFTVLNSVKSSNMTRGYNSGLDFKATFLNNKGKAITNKNMTITIDGKSETVNLENGVLSLNKKLAVGSHTISGKNPVTGEEFSNTVKIVSRIQLNKDMKISYGDAPYYKVRIYGNDGKVVGANQIVSINVAKVTYKVKTDKDGYAKLKINLIPNTYTITISYKGQTVKNKIYVKPVIVAKNMAKKKAKSYKYTVTLKKYTGTLLKGKKVSLTIKGKTYSATTNKKGVATFTIKQTLKVGKYRMTIKYVKSSLVKTLTIKK